MGLMQGIMLSGFMINAGALLLALLACLAAVWSMLSGQGKHKQPKNQIEQIQNNKIQDKKKQDNVGWNKAEAQQDAGRKQQIALLVALRAEADRAEAEAAYSELFGQIGGAIQKLFALAEEKEEREGYKEILENEIQLPVKEAFEAFQVTFTDTGLSFPMQRTEAEPGILARLERLPDSDLADAILKCRGRIERAGRYEIPKGAVNRAAGFLRTLIETPAAGLEWRRMQGISEGIRKALIQSGIYPMFRKDERLARRPDLCALFIEVQGRALIWPGFFIKVDNALELYGSFQGTCHRGEWG